MTRSTRSSPSSDDCRSASYSTSWLSLPTVSPFSLGAALYLSSRSTSWLTSGSGQPSADGHSTGSTPPARRAAARSGGSGSAHRAARTGRLGSSTGQLVTTTRSATAIVSRPRSAITLRKRSIIPPLVPHDAGDQLQCPLPRSPENRQVGESEELDDQLRCLVDQLQGPKPAGRAVQDPEVEDAHLIEPEQTGKCGCQVVREAHVRAVHDLGVERDHFASQRL